MQAWLQPMQVRMSSGRPSRIFRTKSSSAIIARTVPTMSASPSATICSIRAGWVMRPATSTGFDTTFFTAAAPGTATSV